MKEQDMTLMRAAELTRDTYSLNTLGGISLNADRGAYRPAHIPVRDMAQLAGRQLYLESSSS